MFEVAPNSYYKLTAMIERCRDKLSKIFDENYVDHTHGVDHAMKVVNHCQNAIDSDTNGLSEQQKNKILLSALLHDSDDRKYFPMHNNYENARTIMKQQQLNPDFIEQVINIIKVVSFSKNGDSIDEAKPQWFYYTRYADRLQAIGLKGIVRCFEYSMINKTPVTAPNTIRPQSQQQLWQKCEGRQQQYIKRGGTSDSVIDHIFDKLIHISLPKQIKNQYLNEKFLLCQKDIINFVLQCSRCEYKDVYEKIIALKQGFSS